MFKLRVISFFLALVMAIQMLPLEQIGRALSSNTWTEETPHNAEDGGKGDVENLFSKHFIAVAGNHFTPLFSLIRQEIYIHTSDQIPSNHSTDIVTPPPDVVV